MAVEAHESLINGQPQAFSQLSLHQGYLSLFGMPLEER